MSQTARERVVEMARRLALERAIAEKSDGYYERVKGLARRLTQAKLDTTQVRGLETLAYMTDKVSDVSDWLKSRVGRDSKQERWAKEGVGRDLLAELQRLRDDGAEVVNRVRQGHPVPDEDPDLPRQVHLRLIREYLKHLAVHFAYAREGGVNDERSGLCARPAAANSCVER